MSPRPPKGYWQIKENVINDAKKYEKRADWKIKSPGAYVSAYANGWIDECRKLIESQRVEVGYWQTKEHVIKDAKQYKTRSEWSMKSPSAYQIARNKLWLEDCCKHMISKMGKWKIKKNVIVDSKKYKTRSEWHDNSGAAYRSAKLNGWFEICCKHMTTKMGVWQIKMNVINDSRKYETRSEWIKKSNSAYQSAVRNGWLEECRKHTR